MILWYNTFWFLTLANNREGHMEGTMSFKLILQTLRKRLSLILSITFILVFITGLVSYFFLTPVFQASTQLLVNQSKNDQTSYQYNEVQTNLQLINTYNVIIKSPAILELVIKDLDLDMTVGELNEKITVQNEKNSQVVILSVEDSDSKRAAEIANKTAAVFQNEIVKIMNVDNVKILAKASENPSPIKPRPLLNVAAAMIVGLLAGIGVAFLLEHFDNTVKDEREIEKLIGVAVLGVIPTMDESNTRGRNTERKTRLRGETVGS